MTEHHDESTESAAKQPDVPWPSTFEIEVKARLNDIEAHQLRIDRLLIEMQGDIRRAERVKAERDARIESKLDSLVSLIRAQGENGHGHGG
jgi:hypothetical protein